LYPLSDYIDPQFIHRSLATDDVPPIEAWRDIVCFFPNEGGERAGRLLMGEKCCAIGSISCQSAI